MYKQGKLPKYVKFKKQVKNIIYMQNINTTFTFCSESSLYRYRTEVWKSLNV